MEQKTYNLQGKVLKLSAPTIKRVRAIENLNSGARVEDLVNAAKLVLESEYDMEALDWDEVDLRFINEVLSDFLSLVNPTAAAQMRSSLGLAPSSPTEK